jgi:MFS family permease
MSRLRISAAASGPSSFGLAGLNFFIAAAQTGFGAFLVVYLTEQGWTQTAIGTALGIGLGASLLTQLPGGALVDALHGKRLVMAGALVLFAVSAIMMAVWPTWPSVWLAQILHAAVSSVLTPCIAAVTLAAFGPAVFSKQLGSNSRWASLGSAAAALALGGAATFLSKRWIFVLTAAMVLPALYALGAIRPGVTHSPDHDHAALMHPRQRRSEKKRPHHIYGERSLHVFAASILLFQLADAGLLPLALGDLTRHSGGNAGFLASAAIIVPQAIVAVISPAVGRAAQRVGRRPLLLLGFAALPLRAVLFAFLPQAVPFVLIQGLDGISGAVMGVMVPLIAADVTRRSGYLNLAIGSLGLAASLGALPSALLSGWIADRFGPLAAYLVLAAIGLAAVAVIATNMAETRPHPKAASRHKLPAGT